MKIEVENRSRPKWWVASISRSSVSTRLRSVFNGVPVKRSTGKKQANGSDEISITLNKRWVVCYTSFCYSGTYDEKFIAVIWTATLLSTVQHSSTAAYAPLDAPILEINFRSQSIMRPVSERQKSCWLLLTEPQSERLRTRYRNSFGMSGFKRQQSSP